MRYSNSNLRRRPFILSLLFLSLTLVILTALSFRNLKPNDILSTTQKLHHNDQIKPQHHDRQNPKVKRPEWLNLIMKREKPRAEPIKVGLVNVDHLGDFHGDDMARLIPVEFDPTTVKWESLFPEWIDENAKWAPPKCPKIPLPSKTDRRYDDLDIIVVHSPCLNATRDVFQLQVNLVAADVAVRSGTHRRVYVVSVGPCEPMIEIFRCDDVVRRRKGEFSVYLPEMKRLKQKVLMPVGSCQLAPFYSLTGKEQWRSPPPPPPPSSSENRTTHRRAPRYAYATILHSSEAYACGAAALAHSLRRVKSLVKADLVLLADKSSLSNRSLVGLRSAGWKIVPIQRIRSPFAAKGTYNEWNYSKLRVFQLTRYEKVIFIDADLVALRPLDSLFLLPGISAAANDGVLFNSGVMVLEPSACLFEHLMRRSFDIVPYNGGDQGFLNEVFPWWHRLSAKTNYLKVFASGSRKVPADVDAVHYLGLKPWMCYRDYDCNWDMKDRQLFASDEAHRRWWDIYDGMLPESKMLCGLTKKMDWRIRKWRRIAEESNSSDGHWRIKPKDPRRRRFVDS